jgi:hypothetical protein
MPTATKPTSRFKRPAAPDMPNLVCIGRVGHVHEAKLTQAEDFVNQRIDIVPEGNGRSASVFMIYRPEWFDANFDPIEAFTLTDAEREAREAVKAGATTYDSAAYESAKFKYKAGRFYADHFLAPEDSGQISTLEALGGSPEGREALETLLLEAADKTEGAIDMDEVQQILADFVRENNPLLGYRLVQQSTRTDGPDGRAVYVKGSRYEIGSFFYPTEKAIKSFIRSCNNSKGKSKMTFEELPF